MTFLVFALPLLLAALFLAVFFFAGAFFVAAFRFAAMASPLVVTKQLSRAH
jgi:hypothetical protein